MTALPTRKLEAYRYADIDALASVWTSLAPPKRVEIAAQQSLQQIWLPSGGEIDIRRVEMTLEAGAVARIFVLNSASRYGRIELDVTLHEGADFAFYGANIGGGNSTLEIVTTARHIAPGATSHQTIRSVLGGKATGSFLGKIEVALAPKSFSRRFGSDAGARWGLDAVDLLHLDLLFLAHRHPKIR